MKDWWLTLPLRAEDATPHRRVSYLRQRLRTLDRDTAVLLTLVGLALAGRILYVLANPPFLSPDESGHYEYVASLYQSWGHAVRGGEAHQPPLYYLLVLPAYALGVMRQPPDLDVYALAVGQASMAALLATRLMTALISAAAVPFAYWSARSICGKDPFVYLGTAAFVALVPMYSSIGASLNNDALANVLASVLICLAVIGIARGFSARQSILIAIVAGAALLTKASTLVVVGLALLVVAAWWAVQARRRPASVNRVKLTAVGCAGLAAILAIGRIALSSGRIPNPLAQYGGHLSVQKAAVFLAELDPFPFVYQFKTFWASFNSDAIQLPAPLYWFLVLLCFGAAVGLLGRLADASVEARAIGRPRVPALQLLFVVGIALLQWLMCFVRYYTANPVPPSARIAGWDESISDMQGRFLFPAMIALAFLFTYGLKRLVPARLERQALVAFVALLLAVDVFSLITLVVGFYSWQH